MMIWLLKNAMIATIKSNMAAEKVINFTVQSSTSQDKRQAAKGVADPSNDK